MSLRKYLIPSGMVLLMCIVVTLANDISSSIRNSIEVCLTSIVPSMYALMITSELFVKSNSHMALGRIFSPITRRVFHLDGQLFAILLVSLISGYPVGAKMVSTLERNHAIDSSTAENMYCYCYSSGIAFIMGTISTAFDSTLSLKIALIVYTSTVISNLILATILNFRLRNDINTIPPCDNVRIKLCGEYIIDSINSAFRVLINVCLMVTSFGIFITILDSLKVSEWLSIGIAKLLNVTEISAHTILNSLLEISKTSQVMGLGKYYIPSLALLFSFGGVCVIMQVVSIAGESFNFKKFLVCRMVSGGISFGVCSLLCRVFLNGELMAISTLYTTRLTHETSIVPTVCLLCMSLILLKSTPTTE